ncbi:UvrD-helicase domain-containing protein, partial [Candidatus Thiosymbion oneisti]|uniref:UvrD-helicase domain-containing protein n=1 Tax=Candidatus Thiosymbion oneisti TaxID=589554 RepID=UPI0013FE093F
MIALDPLRIPLRGLTLIEASAGTGKTYSITTLYLRLLLELGLEVDRILVVTFTEAATEELRDRIRKRLVQALDWFRGGVAVRGEE